MAAVLEDVRSTTCATAKSVEKLSSQVAGLSGTLARIVDGCSVIAGHARLAPAAGAGGAGAGNLRATPEPVPLNPDQPGVGEAEPPQALGIRPFATFEALGTVQRLWTEWKTGLGPGSTPVETYVTDYAAREEACKRALWKREVRPARAVRADYALAQLTRALCVARRSAESCRSARC
jgi:hypothetical protein